MNLVISFSEIKALVKKKSGKDLLLSCVDGRTMRLGYKANVKVPLLGDITKTFEVDIVVDRIAGEDMYVTYDAGMGVDLIVAGVMKMIPQAQSNSFIELPEKSKAVLHLGRNSKIHDALQHVDIHGVSFKEDGAVVMFDPKM